MRRPSKDNVAKLSDLMEQVTVKSVIRARLTDAIKAKAKLTERFGDIELVALRADRSVHAYFCCSTAQALIELHEMLENGELKSILECVFSWLHDDGQSYIEIAELYWSETDYVNCQNYLRGKHNNALGDRHTNTCLA